MTISVQNNSAALLALQNLNRTNDQLSLIQQQVSTNTAVAQASDSPAVWATAQGQQSQINSLDAVTESLNRAASVSDVALAAGQTVMNLLDQMKQSALSAQDTQLTTAALQSLNTSFAGLLSQISSTLANASFGGANLLDGSSGDQRFLATADATQVVTLSAQNLSLGGAIITVPSTASITSAAAASAVMAQIDASIANATTALGQIGDQAKMISAHNQLVSNLQTLLQSGRGQLIDADVAADSARLSALQVQQQLSQQSLSIANAMPNTLLNLFR